MAMFVKLLESLRDRETPSIPCIKLFKGLISDQNEYTSYSPQTTGTYPSQSGSGYQTAGSGYGNGTGGSALRTRTQEK
jgi:hypothetical protein